MRRRGWSSTRCSCPAGRKGCSRTSASLDEQGRAGLEEERRLAYVGLTRARQARAKIYFAAQPAHSRHVAERRMPSRFLDELPESSVEVGWKPRAAGAGQPPSRFDRVEPFSSSVRHARLAARPRAKNRERIFGREAARLQARAGHDQRKGRRAIRRAARVQARRARVSPKIRLRQNQPKSTATSSPCNSTRPEKSGSSRHSSNGLKSGRERLSKPDAYFPPRDG